MRPKKDPKNSPNKNVKRVRFDHSIYRLNVSYLTGYGTFQIHGKDTKRTVGRCPELDALKAQVLQLLLHRQTPRGLRYYSVAWQTHQSTGQPHLDVLITYDKNILKSLSSFNYLLDICPQRKSESTPGVFVTPYSKTRLNRAVLEYGSKEDPSVLSNFPEDLTSVINVVALQKDPYRYLELQMLKDPLNFNLEQYARTNDLFQHVKSWSSIKTKLKDSQLAAANLLLETKSGFKRIDWAQIRSILNESEIRTFYSWEGYQKIVDKLNEMVALKGRRDPKSLNLLITGPPNCGKSALVWHPNPHGHFNPISAHCSVYPMGMTQWFPKYQSDVYHCIYWNQAKLTSYSYDTILKLLDGSPLDLPNKGSVSRKVDNPLIIMTSNMTLEQMIQQKFPYNRTYQDMARKNLAVRIENVIVPEGYDLFILQKLLKAL